MKTIQLHVFEFYSMEDDGRKVTSYFAKNNLTETIDGDGWFGDKGSSAVWIGTNQEQLNQLGVSLDQLEEILRQEEKKYFESYDGDADVITIITNGIEINGVKVEFVDKSVWDK